MGRDRKGSIGAARGQTPSSSPARISRSARTSRASMAPRIRRRGWVAPPVRTVSPSSRRVERSAKARGRDAPAGRRLVDQAGQQPRRRPRRRARPRASAPASASTACRSGPGGRVERRVAARAARAAAGLGRRAARAVASALGAVARFGRQLGRVGAGRGAQPVLQPLPVVRARAAQPVALQGAAGRPILQPRARRTRGCLRMASSARDPLIGRLWRPAPGRPRACRKAADRRCCRRSGPSVSAARRPGGPAPGRG